MGFFRTKSSQSATAVQSSKPGAVSFTPASSSGARVGGELNLIFDDGPPRKLMVWMTWDALDRLRAELERNERPAGDATILRRVLMHWGVEEYMRRLQTDTRIPAVGILLTFPGGPASPEPARILRDAGLLPRQPSGRGRSRRPS